MIKLRILIQVGAALAVMFQGLPHASANPPGVAEGGAPSSSQTPSAARAEPERLFQEAARRMNAGDYARACPLLEQSQKLEPASGTLLNLGDCYEHLERMPLAYRAFAEARELSISTSRLDRAEVAAARMKRLMPLVHFIQVLPPTRQPEGLSVTLDNEELPASRWSTPLPVEPGVHIIRVSAPGLLAHRGEIAEGPLGTLTTYQIPELARPVPVRASETSGPKLDGQQIAAISAGSLGVAGLVVGTVFGLRSIAKHQQSEDYCGTGPLCQDERGVTRMEEARRAGNVSTAGFIVGGVGLGAAAVLWFVRPFGDPEQRVALEIGPSSLRVRGRF